MKLFYYCVGVRVIFRFEPGVEILTVESAKYDTSLPTDTHLDENTSGKMKFNNAHNSCKLFWSGVPVINSLPLDTNVRMI